MGLFSKKEKMEPCPNCETIMKENDEFCQNCGKSREELQEIYNTKRKELKEKNKPKQMLEKTDDEILTSIELTLNGHTKKPVNSIAYIAHLSGVDATKFFHELFSQNEILIHQNELIRRQNEEIVNQLKKLNEKL